MHKLNLAALTLGIMLVAITAQAGSGAIDRRSHPFPGRYIVELAEPLAAPIDDLLSDIVATVPTAKAVYVWKHAIKGFAMTMTDQQATVVSRLPFVKQVAEDGEVELAAVSTRSWNIDRIDNVASPRLDNLYDYCTTGWGVFVYVLDSGVYGGHDEFSNPDPGYPGMPRVRPGKDVIGTDGPANDPCQGFRDSQVRNGSHGTAVASIIAGRTMGVAREATIVPVRIFDCNSGKTNDAQVIAGIDWILTDPSYPNGAGRVVNMSFVSSITNPPASPTSYENSIHRLLDAGITVVVAAGNQNEAIYTPAKAYLPARMPDVITVAASKGQYPTDVDGRWNDGPSTAPGSNYGPEVDIFAPGDHVLSAFWNSPTAVRDITNNSVSSGTSFACAVASGMAARWVTATGASPAVIRQYFMQNGTAVNIQNAGTGSPNLLTHIGNGCRRHP